jgi:hypothetical protein
MRFRVQKRTALHGECAAATLWFYYGSTHHETECEHQFFLSQQGAIPCTHTGQGKAPLHPVP